MGQELRVVAQLERARYIFQHAIDWFLSSTGKPSGSYGGNGQVSRGRDPVRWLDVVVSCSEEVGRVIDRYHLTSTMAEAIDRPLPGVAMDDDRWERTASIICALVHDCPGEVASFYESLAMRAGIREEDFQEVWNTLLGSRVVMTPQGAVAI